MSTDYRKLCLDLFGTDDEKALRTIAKQLNHNARGAGRKKRFSDKEIDEMNTLLINGVNLSEIARKMSCSRQVVSRYLNPPMHEGCTLRMFYMYKQQPCTIIDVDFKSKKIYINNRTNKIPLRAFGNVENPSWEDFEWFLEDRCYSRGRADLKDKLTNLDLDFYEPLDILEKVHGRFAEDPMWIKFAYKTI